MNFETKQPYWDKTNPLKFERRNILRNYNELLIVRQGTLPSEHSILIDPSEHIILIDPIDKKPICNLDFKIKKFLILHNKFIVILTKDERIIFFHLESLTDKIIEINIDFKVEVTEEFKGFKFQQEYSYYVTINSKGDNYPNVVKIDKKLSLDMFRKRNEKTIFDIFSYNENFYILTKFYLLQFNWYFQDPIIDIAYEFKDMEFYDTFIYKKQIKENLVLCSERNEEWSYFVINLEEKKAISQKLTKLIFFSTFKNKYIFTDKSKIYEKKTIDFLNPGLETDLGIIDIVNKNVLDPITGEIINQNFRELLSSFKIKDIEYYYLGEKKFILPDFTLNNTNKKTILIIKHYVLMFEKISLIIWDMKENEMYTLQPYKYNVYNYKKLNNEIIFYLKETPPKKQMFIVKNGDIIFESNKRGVFYDFVDYIKTNEEYNLHQKEKFDIVYEHIKGSNLKRDIKLDYLGVFYQTIHSYRFNTIHFKTIESCKKWAHNNNYKLNFKYYKAHLKETETKKKTIMYHEFFNVKNPIHKKLRKEVYRLDNGVTKRVFFNFPKFNEVTELDNRNLLRLLFGLKEPTKEEFDKLFKFFNKYNMNIHLATLLKSLNSYLLFEDLIYLYENGKYFENEDLFYTAIFEAIEIWKNKFMDVWGYNLIDSVYKFCQKNELRKKILKRYKKYTSESQKKKLMLFYQENIHFNSFNELYVHLLKTLNTNLDLPNLVLIPEKEKNVEVRCHRELLILESNFFTQLFKGQQWKELKDEKIEILFFNEINLKSLIKLYYVNTLPEEFINVKNLTELLIHTDKYFEEMDKIQLWWWFVNKKLSPKLKKGKVENKILMNIFKNVITGNGTLKLINYGNKLMELKGEDFENYIVKKHNKWCE